MASKMTVAEPTVSDLELSFKVFFFAELYLKNWRSATLSTLIVLRYSRWRPRWPPSDDKNHTIHMELVFDTFYD